MTTSGAVVGIGHSRVFRRAEVPLGLLAVEACRRAVEDAGLTLRDIDGIAGNPFQPFDGAGSVDGMDWVTPDFLTRVLPLDLDWSLWVHGGAGSLGRTVMQALNAVTFGSCRYALVYRALHSPEGQYGFSADPPADDFAQWTTPYGLYPPGLHGLLACRYMDLYGGSRQQLGEFVLQARQNGLQWENGYWTQFHPEQSAGLRMDDYLAARMVASPLGVYDCDIPIQACGALVVSSAERAADLPHAAYVVGSASPREIGWQSLATQGFGAYQRLGEHFGKTLWRNCGFGPSAVDVANIYDGFSIHIPLWLEALGFCSTGQGLSFAEGGFIGPTGKLPLNPAGGSLGAGRVHGIAHVFDAALQAMGRAGTRQVPGAEVSLAVVGPANTASALVFSPEPRK